LKKDFRIFFTEYSVIEIYPVVKYNSMFLKIYIEVLYLYIVNVSNLGAMLAAQL